MNSDGSKNLVFNWLGHHKYDNESEGKNIDEGIKTVIGINAGSDAKKKHLKVEEAAKNCRF